MFVNKGDCSVLEITKSVNTFRFRFQKTQKLEVLPYLTIYESVVPDDLLGELVGNFYKSLTDESDGSSIKNIGRVLFNEIFPVELAEAMKDAGPHIAIYSNNHEIPWEMLHDGSEFLGIKYSVGRCLYGSGTYENKLKVESQERKHFLFIANPTGDLAETEVEAYRLKKFLMSMGMASSYSSRNGASADKILIEMNNTTFEFIHYCGHVVKSPEGSYSFLLNENRYFPIKHMSDYGFGGPFVFLNACASARMECLPGSNYDGAVNSFIRAGACAVMGTLSRVTDQGARIFAEYFYGHLFNGDTLGTAAAKARRDSRQKLSGDKTWASFVLYGNPACSYERTDITCCPSPFNKMRGDDVSGETDPKAAANGNIAYDKRMGAGVPDSPAGPEGLHAGNMVQPGGNINQTANMVRPGNTDQPCRIEAQTAIMQGVSSPDEPARSNNKDIRMEEAGNSLQPGEKEIKRIELKDIDTGKTKGGKNIVLNPENPYINRQYADAGGNIYSGFFRRAGAYILDLIILGVANILLYLVLLAFYFSINNEAYIEDFSDSSKVNLFFNLCVLVGCWLYFALFECSRYQATPGKRAFGILVADDGNRRLTFGRATGRYFSKQLSHLILLAGFMFIFFGRKKKCLHDYIAGTIVINRSELYEKFGRQLEY